MVPAAGGLAWWTLALPVWLVACGLALVGLVAIFRRFERIAIAPASRPGTAAQLAAIGGTALSAAGMFAVAPIGLTGLLALRTEAVDGVPMTGFGALALIFAGVTLLVLSGARREKQLSA